MNKQIRDLRFMVCDLAHPPCHSALVPHQSMSPHYSASARPGKIAYRISQTGLLDGSTRFHLCLGPSPAVPNRKSKTANSMTDFKFAFRQLRRNPNFTAATALTLAPGVLLAPSTFDAPPCKAASSSRQPPFPITRFAARVRYGPYKDAVIEDLEHHHVRKTPSRQDPPAGVTPAPFSATSPSFTAEKVRTDPGAGGCEGPLSTLALASFAHFRGDFGVPAGGPVGCARLKPVSFIGSGSRRPCPIANRESKTANP